MSFRFVRRLLCAALLLGAGSAPAVAEVATCSPTKMKIKTAEGTFSTGSTTFTGVSNMGLIFIQGGTNPSCVVVRFSAASSVIGGGVSRVRAVLDDVSLATPTSISFSGENVSSVAHAVEFLFPSVAPGPHNVRILVSVASGDTVFIDERTMIVQHAP
jgi:hypothetical protein